MTKRLAAGSIERRSLLLVRFWPPTAAGEN